MRQNDWQSQMLLQESRARMRITTYGLQFRSQDTTCVGALALIFWLLRARHVRVLRIVQASLGPKTPERELKNPGRAARMLAKSMESANLQLAKRDTDLIGFPSPSQTPCSGACHPKQKADVALCKLLAVHVTMDVLMKLFSP